MPFAVIVVVAVVLVVVVVKVVVEPGKNQIRSKIKSKEIINGLCAKFKL